MHTGMVQEAGDSSVTERKYTKHIETQSKYMRTYPHAHINTMIYY